MNITTLESKVLSLEILYAYILNQNKKENLVNKMSALKKYQKKFSHKNIGQKKIMAQARLS